MKAYTTYSIEIVNSYSTSSSQIILFCNNLFNANHSPISYCINGILIIFILGSRY